MSVLKRAGAGRAAGAKPVNTYSGTITSRCRCPSNLGGWQHRPSASTSFAAAAAPTAAAVVGSSSDEHFMRLALQQAQLAFEAGEVPIGAVLVVNSEVAAAAYNLTETKQNPLSHAELLCISAAADQQLAWRLQEATLYSTIEPCPMCAGAILQARLARLVYGAKQPRCGADGSWVALFPRQQQRQEQQQQQQQAAGQGCCHEAQLQQADPVAQPQQADLPTHTCSPLQALQEQRQQQQPQYQQPEQQQHQALQPVGPHPFHPDIQVTGGVLAEECATLMREFFRERRRGQKAQQQQQSLHHMAVEAQQQTGDVETEVAAGCS